MSMFEGKTKMMEEFRDRKKLFRVEVSFEVEAIDKASARAMLDLLDYRIAFTYGNGEEWEQDFLEINEDIVELKEVDVQ